MNETISQSGIGSGSTSRSMFVLLTGNDTVYEILLVHKPRVYDAWQLPQGGIEEGEDPETSGHSNLWKRRAWNLRRLVDHVSTCTYSYDFPPQFIARHHPVNQGQTLCFVLFVATRDQKVTVDNKRDRSVYFWVLQQQIPLYIKREAYVKVIQEVIEESMEKLRS